MISGIGFSRGRGIDDWSVPYWTRNCDSFVWVRTNHFTTLVLYTGCPPRWIRPHWEKAKWRVRCSSTGPENCENWIGEYVDTGLLAWDHVSDFPKSANENTRSRIDFHKIRLNVMEGLFIIVHSNYLNTDIVYWWILNTMQHTWNSCLNGQHPSW